METMPDNQGVANREPSVIRQGEMRLLWLFSAQCRLLFQVRCAWMPTPQHISLGRLGAGDTKAPPIAFADRRRCIMWAICAAVAAYLVSIVNPLHFVTLLRKR